MHEDEATRATNDDASLSKSSAIKLGYWTDPYIQYFVRASERKSPEINRGYYARVTATKLLLKQFLQATNCECQIVNLGAGFDTTYWNLKDEGLCPKNFIEVDFPGVTERKCYYIKSKKPLLQKISDEDSEIKISRYDLHTDRYHIVSCDMRNLAEFEAKLAEAGFDKSVPTLFIAECVLVYMTSESSTALVKWIGDNVPSAFFISYEQVNMTDRFGQVMVSNLKSRGCVLAGIQHCASLEAQQDRFLKNGWESALALDMNLVYKNLPQADVQRIERLEFMDEYESLNQLFAHYCICTAYKGSTKTLFLNQISLLPT